MMRIIEIAALPNGAHRNQTYDFDMPEDYTVPEGWAIIPDDVEIPASFPFVGVTSEAGIVTELTAGVMPEPSSDPEPASPFEALEAQVFYTAMMTDTLIEEA